MTHRSWPAWTPSQRIEQAIRYCKQLHYHHPFARVWLNDDLFDKLWEALLLESRFTPWLAGDYRYQMRDAINFYSISIRQRSAYQYYKELREQLDPKETRHHDR